MKPINFDYFSTTDLKEALVTLDSIQENAKIIAGGQSLIPVLNMRLARPKMLIDINKIEELKKIETTNDEVIIGATVRHADVVNSSLIKNYLPLLAEVIPHVGHTQIRNRGTIVGSIVHADPSSEISLVAVLLEAKLEIKSLNNTRLVDITDFYYGYMMTDLQPDEMVTAVVFPKLNVPKNQQIGIAFKEMARRKGDFALVAAACQVILDSEGIIHAFKLGVGGVGPIPIRLTDYESSLHHKRAEGELVKELLSDIDSYLEPDDDPFVPSHYRIEVAKRLLKQVILEACNMGE